MKLTEEQINEFISNAVNRIANMIFAANSGTYQKSTIINKNIIENILREELANIIS